MAETAAKESTSRSAEAASRTACHCDPMLGETIGAITAGCASSQASASPAVLILISRAHIPQHGDPGEVTRIVHTGVIAIARNRDPAAGRGRRTVEIPVRQHTSGQRGVRHIADPLRRHERQEVPLITAAEQAKAILHPFRTR